MCGLFIFRQVGLCGEPLIIAGDGGFGDDSGVGAGAVSVADIFPGYNLFPMTTTRLGFYDNGRSRNAMNNRCSVFFLLQQVFVVTLCCIKFSLTFRGEILFSGV